MVFIDALACLKAEQDEGSGKDIEEECETDAESGEEQPCHRVDTSEIIIEENCRKSITESTCLYKGARPFCNFTLRPSLWIIADFSTLKNSY